MAMAREMLSLERAEAFISARETDLILSLSRQARTLSTARALLRVPRESREASNNAGPNLTHLRDYGALRVFASATCPICLDKYNPVITLKCGHCVCEDDYRQLGGYLPSENERSADAGVNGANGAD